MNVLWKIMVPALALLSAVAFAQESRCLPDLAAMDENIHSAILPFEPLIESMINSKLLTETDINEGTFLTATNEKHPERKYLVIKSVIKSGTDTQTDYFIFEAKPKMLSGLKKMFTFESSAGDPSAVKVRADKYRGLVWSDDFHYKEADGPFVLNNGERFVIIHNHGYNWTKVKELPPTTLKNAALRKFSKIVSEQDDLRND